MEVKKYFSHRREFNQILKDIKSIKIQGARNIAKAALRAYFLFPSEKSKKKILATRLTEPMMAHVLELVEKFSKKEILAHFDFAQNQINKNLNRIMRSNTVVFTHCHSTNVLAALIFSKKQGKKFEVYNTETRPLFQGRKTASDLRKAKIKVTMFVDSALGIALSQEQGAKKVSKIFLGADAITKKGVINKVGSEVIAQIARTQKIPVYIVADSWKFSKTELPIEQRKLQEVWKRAPKGLKIKNPAFEFIDRKYIKGIISEFGILSYSQFLKKVN